MLASGLVLKDTYEVERLLGEGGMAQVYVVRHLRLPRRLALKLIAPGVLHAPTARERFRREAEILARLHHPHIVDVIDWNMLADGTPYLVMDLLEGEDLATLLARRGALPLSQALDLLRQIGDALHYAHGCDVVHRDLKPSNIFLCGLPGRPAFVKVLDFGVARLIAEGSGRPATATAQLIGTPAYMAPEQALGKGRDADTRADQFALAAIAYEMLTGQAAFACPGDSTFSVLERVIYKDPPLVGVPNPQAAALARALRKKREERFPAIDAFVAALCKVPQSPSSYRPLAALGAAVLSLLCTSGASTQIPPTAFGSSVALSLNRSPRSPSAFVDSPLRTAASEGQGGMARPAAQAAAPVPPLARSASRWNYHISGVTTAQEAPIRACLRPLGRLRPVPYRIRLLRVGSLKVQKTDPPDLEDEVREGELPACLRRAFPSKESTPELVSIQAVLAPALPR